MLRFLADRNDFHLLPRSVFPPTAGGNVDFTLGSDADGAFAPPFGVEQRVCGQTSHLVMFGPEYATHPSPIGR